MKDVIEFDIAQFKSASPTLSVTKQKPIIISKQKTAQVYYFPGQTNGSYETIAFIEEKKGVTSIIISSRTEKAMKEFLSKFEELVKSYNFLTDKVNVN